MPAPLSRTRLCPFIALALAIMLSGCASKPVASFERERPVFKPEKFFAGRTRSWGVFETRSGQPTQVIETRTTGRLKPDGLHFEQDLLFAGGKKTHRTWLVRRTGEHSYEATGTGIVGVARGEAYGNTFRLDFIIDAFPGHPLGHLRLTQWMYLQPDGVSMVNRAVFRKAGFVVAQITEHFRKER